MVDHPLAYHYPFYKIDDVRGRPSLIGSGVLAEFNGLYFILTAAHVLDELGGALNFPEIGIEALVPVAVTTSPEPATGRKDDALDVGIAHLPSDVASLLKRRFRFKNIGDLKTADAHEEDKKYCFSGYPASRTRLRFASRALDVDCYEYRLSSLPIAAGSQWHPALHIAGAFRRDEMRTPGGPRITAPEPNGMSGGGVWVYESPGYKLAGIGINWDSQMQALIGVRIGAWCAFLRALHPGLKDCLPIDPQINLRFE